jgi:hypothetical protein
MPYTELIIDEHKKIVVVFEEEKVIIISDLYPCSTNFTELKGSSVELNKVAIVFQDIAVPEPFLEGRIEFLCISSKERCMSINAILKVSQEHYKQRGLEGIVDEVKKLLQQYENCVVN